MKWDEDPDPFLSTRFTEEIRLDNGYWLYKHNGVRFPEPPWSVYDRKYPNGNLITFAYTKTTARFGLRLYLWRASRRNKRREKQRNWLRRRGM